MVERIETELIDDIDGSSAGETITFALDGVNYTIDLNEQHAEDLRSLLAGYIRAARRTDVTATSSQQEERTRRRARQAHRDITDEIRQAAEASRRHRQHQQRGIDRPTEADETQPAETVPVPSSSFSHRKDASAGKNGGVAAVVPVVEFSAN